MPPPAEGFASRLILGPALRTQPDRRLVTLVRDGYETAFEEIVRRYGKPLGRYAASIVGGRSEDVLQDAFAKALPALRRDGAEIDLRPWLFRIVRNTALNDLRDNPPAPELLAEALAGGRNPAEELERREELADLMRRLQELPAAQRAAIVMRELEGLGHDEIAAALGLTDGGARQAIYRARRALRDGAGLLLPLPLLRLLIDHGAEAAGASGALATVGTSAGGAGGAAKLGVVAVVLAGSVGAGVAVQDQRGNGQARAVEPTVSRGAAAAPLAEHPALAVTVTGQDDSGSGQGEGGNRRDDQGERQDDGSNRGHGRHGGGGEDPHGGRRYGDPRRHEGERRHGEDRGGRRRGGGDGPRGPGDGGQSGRAGSGRGGNGLVREDRDGRHGGESSGPSDGGDRDDLRAGSGPGTGDNSGPGGGDPPPPPPPPPLPEEGSSSGSGGSSDPGADERDRSGSGTSGSGGSGPDDPG